MKEEPATFEAGVRHSAWTRVIGIVGGLGPHAHIRFEELLLREAEVRASKSIVRDQDYPPYLVSSLPETPDRTEYLLGRGPSPLPWLEHSLRALSGGPEGSSDDRLRADFAVIACNTAHSLLPELEAARILPILDLVSETIDSIRDRKGVRRIGLLATTGTLEAKVYQAACESRGVTAISLQDLPGGEHFQQSLVMASIYGTAERPGIKGGAHRQPEHTGRLLEDLERAVVLLTEAGAEVIIAGCTEIPLVLKIGPSGLALQIEVVDPLQIAAQAALEIAAGERALPFHRKIIPRRSSA